MENWRRRQHSFIIRSINGRMLRHRIMVNSIPFPGANHRIIVIIIIIIECSAWGRACTSWVGSDSTRLLRNCRQVHDVKENQRSSVNSTGQGHILCLPLFSVLFCDGGLISSPSLFYTCHTPRQLYGLVGRSTRFPARD